MVLVLFVHDLYCSLSFCCVSRILSCIVITLLGKRDLVALVFFGLPLCTVCHGLFVFPLGIIGIIGRLCFMIFVLPGHILQCFQKICGWHTF